MQKTPGIISLVIVIVLIIIGFWLELSRPRNEQIFCTQEAKLCSDGSYVGRTGPVCSFALCPGESVPD